MYDIDEEQSVSFVDTLKLKVLGPVLVAHLTLPLFLLYTPGCSSDSASKLLHGADSGVLTSSSFPEEEDTPMRVTPRRPNTGGSSSAQPSGGGNARILASEPVEAADPLANFEPGQHLSDFAPSADSPQDFDPAAFKPTQSSGQNTFPLQVQEADYISYKVRPGDTISEIAENFGVRQKAILDANNLTRNSVIRVDQTLQVPTTDEVSPAPTATAADKPALSEGAKSYVVRSNDSLWRIAHNHGISVDELKQANGITGETIQPDQTLVIPTASGGSAQTTPSARNYNDPGALISTDLPTGGVIVDEASGKGIHVVRSGENPGSIARKYDMSPSQLMALNNISDARKLQVGQELRIQTGGSSNTTASSSNTPAKKRSLAAEIDPDASIINTPVTEGGEAADADEVDGNFRRTFNDVLMIPVTRE